MNATVAANVVVVKRDEADGRADGVHDRGMAGFVERLRWAMQIRQWSARELARRAGMQETHVSSIIRRLETKPAADIEVSTVVRLARATGLTIEWLATGEGDVWQVYAAPDVYPMRQRATRAARELGLSEEGIASVLGETVHDGETKSARWWFDRMQARHVLYAPEETITPGVGTRRKPDHEPAAPTRKSRKT